MADRPDARLQGTLLYGYENSKRQVRQSDLEKEFTGLNRKERYF